MEKHLNGRKQKLETVRLRRHICGLLRDSVLPFFTGESLVYSFKQLCSSIPHNSVQETKYPGFQNRKDNKHLTKMCRKILTYMQE